MPVISPGVNCDRKRRQPTSGREHFSPGRKPAALLKCPHRNENPARHSTGRGLGNPLAKERNSQRAPFGELIGAIAVSWGVWQGQAAPTVGREPALTAASSRASHALYKRSGAPHFHAGSVCTIAGTLNKCRAALDVEQGGLRPGALG